MSEWEGPDPPANTPLLTNNCTGAYYKKVINTYTAHLY